MSRIGIDFGTSNYLASRCTAAQIALFRLADGGRVMPKA